MASDVNMRAWQARDENTSRVECLIRNEECLLYTKTLNNGFQELSKNIDVVVVCNNDRKQNYCICVSSVYDMFLNSVESRYNFGLYKNSQCFYYTKITNSTFNNFPKNIELLRGG